MKKRVIPSALTLGVDENGIAQHANKPFCSAPYIIWGIFRFEQENIAVPSRSSP
jgi:hypothetical protein